MASFTLITSVPKFGHAGAAIARTPAWNPRVFAAATPRPIQVPSSHNEDGSVTSDGVKQGSCETVNNSLNESTQDKAYSTAEHVSNKTKEVAGQISETAQNITEKAKQTIQQAWDSTRNTANKAADSALGKAEESAEYVKENAETVKKNMNRKE